MTSPVIAILFSILIAATYYYSNKVDLKPKRYYHKVVSFSAGVSVTYLLLELIPVFTAAALAINRLLFLAVLFGFIIHHLIEKEIYQHTKGHELRKDLGIEENVFGFVYHIILGIVMVTFLDQNPLKGVLFFITVLSFVFVSTLPTSTHRSRNLSIFLASATLIGTLFASFVWLVRPPWLETLLVGFATGVMIFTIIRHHIPFGRRGRIGYFTIGFLIYTGLILMSWYI